MTDLPVNLNEQIASSNDSAQYLTVSVLKETMAIGILDVKEIIEVGAMTRVPMTIPSIRGVINLRGNVVPVIDLSCRLGNKKAELTKRSCIVLVDITVDDEAQAMGMLVDEVNEIVEIPEQKIQKTPNFGTDIDPGFILNMGRIDQEFIILLNISKVLSIDELSNGFFNNNKNNEKDALLESSAS